MGMGFERALVDDCAQYLKDDETPRQRMDRYLAEMQELGRLYVGERQKVEDLKAALDHAAPRGDDYHKSQECMRIQNELVAERDRALKALAKSRSVNERLRAAMHKNEKTSIASVQCVADERDRLREALHRISLGSQDGGTTKESLGIEARAALAAVEKEGRDD